MPASRPETPVPDLLAFLAGRWRVERTAEDRHTGTRGHFTGTADFTALPGGGLRHHEEGVFTWDGVARPAYRTLRWLPGPHGAASARVTFDDGRFFHDLDLRTGHAVADHPCSLDLYRGEFTVSAPDVWSVVWRVAGPAKDLILRTEHTREAPSTQ
ncbi:DUF6314 family protein [Streptomyces sp. SID11385]|uniref:DUF6314 family protein n=1 Tax=Streptomyces sp. SID11385 TaxID=2706031 RepID=UPI0013CADEDA|nr:DUF6314 family protein [Streptomyces sp. SID11385]NEA41593.1 hypothetical protein [Streptomyces sp. SID11385]